MAKAIGILLFSILFLFHCAGALQEEEDEDAFEQMMNRKTPEDWIHPSEAAFSKGPKKNTALDQEDLDSLLLCQSDLKACREKLKTNNSTSSSKRMCRDTYLIRFVNVLLLKFSSRHSNDDYEVDVRLTSYDIQLLSDFVSEKEAININDIDHVLSNFITGVRPHDSLDSYYEDYSEVFRKYVPSTQDLFWILTFSVFTGSLIMLWNGIPVWKFSLLLLALSSTWHWTHMYKKAMSAKYSTLVRNEKIPKECFPDEMGWMHYIFDSYTRGDRCSEYHDALLVDPLWEVSPTMAIAETISQFVLLPLEHLGRNIGRFFNSLVSELPWFSGTLVLGFIFITLLIIIVIITVMGFGYRLRLPFFFGALEPPSNDDNNPKLRALKEEVSKLQDTVQDLRNIHLQALEFNHIQRVRELECSNSSSNIKISKESSSSKDPSSSSTGPLVPGKHVREEIGEDCPPLKKPRNKDSNAESERLSPIVTANKVQELLLLSPPTNFKAEQISEKGESESVLEKSDEPSFSEKVEKREESPASEKDGEQNSERLSGSKESSDFEDLEWTSSEEKKVVRKEEDC